MSEIIETGKRMFNLSPDEQFNSITDLLETARLMHLKNHYLLASSRYCETLAKELDKEVKS